MVFNIEQVKKFYDRYNIPYGKDHHISGKVHIIKQLHLIYEELSELESALYTMFEYDNDNKPIIPVNVAKEMADVIYVVFGMVLDLGISPQDMNRIFSIVHKANMTKSGKFNEFGKLLKGDDYIIPIEKIRNEIVKPFYNK